MHETHSLKLGSSILLLVFSLFKYCKWYVHVQMFAGLCIYAVVEEVFRSLSVKVLILHCVLHSKPQVIKSILKYNYKGVLKV